MKTKAKPTSIRLPEDLSAKVQKLAEREHRSISNAIEIALVRYFAGEARQQKDRHA